MKKIRENIIAGTDEARIDFDGKELYASVEFVGEKDATHLSDDNVTFDASQHNVISISLGKDGDTVEFDAWGSKREPSLEYKPESTTYMIMQDAISYLDCDSLEDFCSTFGYELYDEEGETNPRVETIYEMCEETLDKLKSIGLTEDDIYTIADILREKDNDGTLDEEEDDDDEIDSFQESKLKCFRRIFKEARSTGLFYIIVDRNGQKSVYHPNDKTISHRYEDIVALKKSLESDFPDCKFTIADENDELVKAATDGMNV